jgi:hypothetical protein
MPSCAPSIQTWPLERPSLMALSIKLLNRSHVSGRWPKTSMPRGRKFRSQSASYRQLPGQCPRIRAVGILHRRVPGSLARRPGWYRCQDTPAG